MSKLTITMRLDDDAFAGDNCGPEVARILRGMAKRIEQTSRDDLEGHSYNPQDINGNLVGSCDFEIDEEEVEELCPNDVRYALRFLRREEIVMALESVSIQCYDHEPTDDLLQALINSVMDEDLTLDDALSFAD